MATILEKAKEILQEKTTKIIPENIKQGINIFGIDGTLKEGIDTSNATATANDILQGMTAYVKGKKIIGCYTDPHDDLFKFFNFKDEMDNIDSSEVEVKKPGIYLELGTTSLTENTKAFIFELPSTFDITGYTCTPIVNDWGTSYPYYSLQPVDGSYNDSLQITCMEEQIQIHYSVNGISGNITYNKTGDMFDSGLSPVTLIFDKMLQKTQWSEWDDKYSNIINVISYDYSMLIGKSLNNTSQFRLTPISECSMGNISENNESTDYIIDSQKILNLITKIKNESLNKEYRIFKS